MSKVRVVEPLVKTVLEENEVARNDDFVLIAEVYYKLNPVCARLSFATVMLGHKELKLPSIASITRSRRKLQRIYEYLRPNKEVDAIRADEENEYIDYAIDGYKNTFSKFVNNQE